MAEKQPMKTFQAVDFTSSFRWLAELRAKRSAAKAASSGSGKGRSQSDIEGIAKGYLAGAEIAKQEAVEQGAIEMAEQLQQDVMMERRQLEQQVMNNPQATDKDKADAKIDSLRQVMSSEQYLNRYTAIAGVLDARSFSDFLKLNPRDTGAVASFIKGSTNIQEHLKTMGYAKLKPAAINVEAFEYAARLGLNESDAMRVAGAARSLYTDKKDDLFKEKEEYRKNFLANAKVKEQGLKLQALIIDTYEKARREGAIFRAAVPILKDETANNMLKEAQALEKLGNDILIGRNMLEGIVSGRGGKGRQAVDLYIKTFTDTMKEWLGQDKDVGFVAGMLGLDDDEFAKAKQAATEEARKITRERHGKSASQVIQDISMLDTAMGNIFTSFRGTITGAQASAKELEWLMRTVFNPEGTENKAIGQLDFWYGASTAVRTKLFIEATMRYKIPTSSKTGQLYLYNAIVEDVNAEVANQKHLAETERVDYAYRIVELIGDNGFFTFRSRAEKDGKGGVIGDLPNNNVFMNKPTVPILEDYE